MTAILDIMHSYYAATHSKETWPSSGHARLERNWDLDGSDHGWEWWDGWLDQLDHGATAAVTENGGPACSMEGVYITCNKNEQSLNSNMTLFIFHYFYQAQ